MAGRSVRSRIERLERLRRPGNQAQPYGVPSEEIRATFREHLVVFTHEVATRAVEVRAAYDRGETLPDPLSDKAAKIELQAHLLAVLDRDGEDAVPESWLERVEDRSRWPPRAQEWLRELDTALLSVAWQEYQELRANREESE